MNVNRREREEEVAALLAQLDSTAIQMAQLEWLCHRLPSSVAQQGETVFLVAGQRLYYNLVKTPHHSHLLYPALVECLEACLSALGRRFIAEQPSEQMPLMRLVRLFRGVLL